MFANLNAQNTDYQQAKYLKDHGCKPQGAAKEGETLTERFAHGCPATPEGVTLSQQALAVAARQHQQLSGTGGDHHGHTEHGTGHHEEHLSLSPAALQAMGSNDAHNAETIAHQMQANTDFIKSGAWLHQGQQH